MSVSDCEGFPEWLVRPPDSFLRQDGNAKECDDDISKYSETEYVHDSDVFLSSNSCDDSSARTFEDSLTMP